jgi:hypothetical protein
MPPTWAYGHIDWKYIRTINKSFGNRRLKDYLHITPLKYLFYMIVKRIKIVSILNYLPYRKSEAMKILTNELGWQYYGGKHYESIYTRFYQGFILLNKFKIDKRKAHLSTLIFSGQLTREEAMEELKKPVYPTNLFEEDRKFVMKKFEISEEEFDRILKLPVKTFHDYPNQSNMFKYLRQALNYLRKKGILYS